MQYLVTIILIIELRCAVHKRQRKSYMIVFERNHMIQDGKERQRTQFIYTYNKRVRVPQHENIKKNLKDMFFKDGVI